MTEDDARIAAAWDVAAKALVRGGHTKRPSWSVQTAAVNWVIRQDLARFLLAAVQTGDHNARLFAEDGHLFFAADEIEGIDLGSVRALSRGPKAAS
jgi:hypothetical protein